MIKVAKTPPLTEEHIDVIKQVADSGQLVDGEFTRRFEDAWSSFTGKNYGVATCNGTIALYTALKAIGIKKDDRVLVPPLTFFATIEAVKMCGGIPIFSDIEEETWCMNPFSVGEICGDEDIKCIVPVDVFGNPCDIKGILQEGKNIPIVQDCCQAHGSFDSTNEHVGSYADIACYSFMATKNLTNFGEGGMCCTGNKRLYDYMQKFIRHGMIDRHTHQFLGINGKMSEIHAALGYVEYQKLNDRVLNRVNQHEFYKQHLRKVSWLKPQKVKHGISSRFWSAWYVDYRDKKYNGAEDIHKMLKEKGIETRFRYKHELTYQPAIYEGDLPFLSNASKICGNVIGLPLGEHLIEDDLVKIVDTIKSL